MQIITFLAFTLVVAFISWRATRNTNEQSADGYYLGGRSLTGWVIAGSLLLTNLSTEQIVGLNGSAYKEGVVVMAWETLAAIAIVITAIFLLPRYLKNGLTTIPEFLESRYDKGTRSLTSALFLSGYIFILLPIVLYSGALALNGMFDVPQRLGLSHMGALWVSVWAIGLIGAVYAIFGGLRAVAVSDSVNAIGLLIGGMMIPVLGIMMVGDGDLFGGIKILTEAHPEKFVAAGGPDSSIPFATIFTGMMLVQLFYWGTNQAIIQRALGAKNLKEGQKGLMIAAFVKILGPLIVVVPGIVAYHLIPELGENGTEDLAYPLLVAKVLPPAFLGFFAAVMFGAILSSFNSALNSAVTLFGVDLYGGVFRPDKSQEEKVKVGKRFGWLVAGMSMGVAPLIAYAPDGLFGYLQEVNGCYSIPILTIVVVGYSTKYVPALAAKVALVSGVVLYSVSQFIISPIVGEEDYPHFLHVMAILFLANIVIMLAIGAWKPRKEAYVLEESGAVDTTGWKPVGIVGAAIVLVVVSTYIFFA